MKRLFILFLFIVPVCSHAQYWDVGVGVGGMGYIGDINPNNLFSISDYGFSIKAKYNFNSRTGIEISYLKGRVSADDSTSFNDFQQIRNLNFYSAIDEVSVLFNFNYFKYIPGKTGKRFTPCTFLGLGLFNFNPKTKYQGKEYSLVFLGTEGQTEDTYYKTYSFAFIYGMGIRFNFTDAFTFQFEIGYRRTFTDYLDDVSQFYPEPSELSGSLSRALSDRSSERNNFSTGQAGLQRGDFRTSDHYLFTAISISYAIIPLTCFLNE